MSPNEIRKQAREILDDINQLRDAEPRSDVHEWHRYLTNQIRSPDIASHNQLLAIRAHISTMMY